MLKSVDSEMNDEIHFCKNIALFLSILIFIPVNFHLVTLETYPRKGPFCSKF
jgi:hypothetical protein